MKKMQENQEGNYFTPTIEELHIGYQCETREYSATNWYKCTIDEEMYSCDNDGCYKNNCPLFNIEMFFRTPFLTKEQIEKEFDEEVDKKYWCVKYWDVWNDSSKHRYIVRYRFENQRMQICRDDDADVVFDGYIRCVNEFKTLLKLLRVK